MENNQDNLMRRYFLIAFLITVFFAVNIYAEGNGGFSGAFLRVGLGARALAMGNAQVASAEHGYGTYYNPAALPNLEKRNFSISYSSMSLDRKFNFIGFSLPLPPVAGASIGWINSGVGDLRAYNSIGQDVGEINHGLNAVFAAFALKVVALAQMDNQLVSLPADLINIGITVKFLREDLGDNEDFDYKGSGFGIDVGLLIKPHSNLSLGYQVKDLNSSLSSNTNNLFERGSDLDNNFPLTQKLGLFYRTPLDWIAVAYDFEWSNKGEKKHHLGAELSSSIAFGRLGYDNDHFTLGGGLQFRAYKSLYMSLDYAFVEDVVDEGISHVFSWQFLF
jgi:hypothetical protein